jgi:hypothetical protein
MFSQSLTVIVALLVSSSNGFSLNNSNSKQAVVADRRSFFNSIASGTATAVSTASLIMNPSTAVAAEQEGLTIGGKVRFGDESIMSPKEHGTSNTPVQESLRYDVDRKLANRITNYNRRFAEFGVSLFYFGFFLVVALSVKK